jgi:hypothetical protein
MDNATAAGVGFALTPVSGYPLDENLWYRAHVTLSSTADLTADIFSDDEATGWINGVQFYVKNNPGGGSGLGYWYTAGVTIPAANLVVGDNVLVFQSRETWGGQAYFDYRLSQPTYTPPETPSSAPSIVTVLATSNLSTGTLRLRYSKDGASNWTQWRNLDVGAAGSFLKPLVARQLGQATQRVWEINDTSEYPSDILAVAIQYA